MDEEDAGRKVPGTGCPDLGEPPASLLEVELDGLGMHRGTTGS